MVKEIPIEVLDEQCANCPEIEIETSIQNLYSDGIETMRIIKHYCKHVDFCKNIKMHHENAAHEEHSV